MFSDLQLLDLNIFPLKPTILYRLLLFGNASFKIELNQSILNTVIRYICDTERFSGLLF